MPDGLKRAVMIFTVWDPQKLRSFVVQIQFPDRPCRRQNSRPDAGARNVWQHRHFAFFAYFVLFVVQIPTV